MEDLYSEDISRNDDYFAFDWTIDDSAQDDYARFLPCVGRGLKVLDIARIKMPSDLLAEMKTDVRMVQSFSQAKPPPVAGKGRAQIIEEDKRKCRKPGGDNSTPCNSDTVQPGNNVYTENVVPILSATGKIDKKIQYEEHFPPLVMRCKDASYKT